MPNNLDFFFSCANQAHRRSPRVVTEMGGGLEVGEAARIHLDPTQIYIRVTCLAHHPLGEHRRKSAMLLLCTHPNPSYAHI